MSPVTTFLSDPTQDPTSVSFHSSPRLKPAQTCPGLARALLGPVGVRGGREKMQHCCNRSTFGAFRSCPTAEAGSQHPPTPPFSLLPVTSCGCLPCFCLWLHSCVCCPPSPSSTQKCRSSLGAQSGLALFLRSPPGLATHRKLRSGSGLVMEAQRAKASEGQGTRLEQSKPNSQLHIDPYGGVYRKHSPQSCGGRGSTTAGRWVGEEIEPERRVELPNG